MGGTATWPEVVLFLAGIVLLAIEIFLLPGHGISAFIGILLTLSALVLASQDFLLPNNKFELAVTANALFSVLGSAVLVTVVIVAVTMYTGRVPFLSRLVLDPPVADGRGVIKTAWSLANDPDGTRALDEPNTTIAREQPSTKMVNDRPHKTLEPHETLEMKTGFVVPETDDLAKHFPQLEILEFLGRGGMGAVHKARQPALDRFVALKVLPPEVARDSNFAERFSREAQALAKVNHPHIVTIHDCGCIDGLYYLVMEFVDGVDLGQMIQSGGVAPEQALSIISQICDALQCAHDHGVVHRDIKPANILLDSKGFVKVADFGLAKLMGRSATDYSLTATDQVMGTPRYMAPEQIESTRTVDHQSDIYSLGVVFYELLTGELPIGLFPPPSQRAPIDTRLDAIVFRTLEKEPERRYQNASEVKSAVTTICEG